MKVSPGYGKTYVKLEKLDSIDTKLSSIKSLLEIPTEGGTFQKTVGTSAVRLSTSSVEIKTVVIKADDDNSGNIYIGFSSGVTTSNGFRLKAGQGIEIAIDNLNKIWLIADADNQKVHVLWLR